MRLSGIRRKALSFRSARMNGTLRCSPMEKDKENLCDYYEAQNVCGVESLNWNVLDG